MSTGELSVLENNPVFVLVALLAALAAGLVALIQFMRLAITFEETPRYQLPPHTVRIALTVVVCSAAFVALINVVPASNAQRWSIPSFVLSLLVFLLFQSGCMTVWIAWKLRKSRNGMHLED
jgi:uncharacterized BrkB/YihY/UPF0761 family membrane protein